MVSPWSLTSFRPFFALRLRLDSTYEWIFDYRIYHLNHQPPSSLPSATSSPLESLHQRTVSRTASTETRSHPGWLRICMERMKVHGETEWPGKTASSEFQIRVRRAELKCIEPMPSLSFSKRRSLSRSPQFWSSYSGYLREASELEANCRSSLPRTSRFPFERDTDRSSRCLPPLSSALPFTPEG